MLPTNPMDIRKEKMKRELDELEASIMKKGPESPTQPDEAKEEGSPTDEANSIAEQEVKPNVTVKDLAYWKSRCLTAENRFNTAKPKYDSNIYKLKQENLGLKKDRVELSRSLNKARQAVAVKRGDPLDEIFGKEQVDVLGQETVDKLKKMITDTNKRVDSQAEQAEAKRLLEDEKNLRDDITAEYDVFTNRLNDLVENMDELNHDPKFIKWLQRPDKISGDIRQEILLKAETSRDVGRVAEIFNQYKPKGKRKPPVDSINKRIAPVSNEGPNSVSDIDSKGKMTMAEVDQFYDDVKNKLYDGRYTEKVAMMEKIDAAQFSGNIIY